MCVCRVKLCVRNLGKILEIVVEGKLLCFDVENFEIRDPELDFRSYVADQKFSDTSCFKD